MVHRQEIADFTNLRKEYLVVTIVYCLLKEESYGDILFLLK